MATNKELEQHLSHIQGIAPRAEFPQDKSEWNMGHKCMAYINKAINFESLLVPTWMLTQFYRADLHLDSTATSQDHTSLLLAWQYSLKRLTALRKITNETISSIPLINKYRVTNCGELGELACLWMQKHHQYAYKAKLDIQKDTQSVMKSEHVIVLYSASNKKMSFCEMRENITDTDIWILDVWAQKCGPAMDVLKDLSNILVCDKKIDEPKLLPDKSQIVLTRFVRPVDLKSEGIRKITIDDLCQHTVAIIHASPVENYVSPVPHKCECIEKNTSQNKQPQHQVE